MPVSYDFAFGAIALSETVIIDMMAIAAPIRPPLLIPVAIRAQFSAAVADTSGSGGLLSGLAAGGISAHGGYALLTIIGLASAWFDNVLEIACYASRAIFEY